MSDRTPEPQNVNTNSGHTGYLQPGHVNKGARTDEELRQAIRESVAKATYQVNLAQGSMSFAEADKLHDRTTDKVMALIQADRERLYGELVAAKEVFPYRDIGGIRGVRAIPLSAIKKVFNREGTDNG